MTMLQWTDVIFETSDFSNTRSNLPFDHACGKRGRGSGDFFVFRLFSVKQGGSLVTVVHLWTVNFDRFTVKHLLTSFPNVHTEPFRNNPISQSFSLTHYYQQISHWYFSKRWQKRYTEEIFKLIAYFDKYKLVLLIFYLLKVFICLLKVHNSNTISYALWSLYLNLRTRIQLWRPRNCQFLFLNLM